MGPLSFAYEAPASVEEAVALLARHSDRAKILAGGQSLVPMMTFRLIQPEVVIDINGLGFDGIRRRDGYLDLGALVRHRVLEESGEIADACPLLSEAAALIGNVRIRTLGTLGGSLAHADPAAELPMTALALDAELTIQGQGGARKVPVGDFFLGIFQTALAPDEILTSISVPVRQASEGWAVQEFARRSGDFAIVAVGARLTLDGSGRMAMTRVCLAGVGPRPLRLLAVEDSLIGQRPDPDVLARAAERVAAEIAPESDVHASAAYRRHLAVVLTRRALALAAAKAQEGGPA